MQKKRLKSAAVLKTQLDKGKASRFNEEQLYWSNYDLINRQNINKCTVEVSNVHNGRYLIAKKRRKSSDAQGTIIK